LRAIFHPPRRFRLLPLILSLKKKKSKIEAFTFGKYFVEMSNVFHSRSLVKITNIGASKGAQFRD
jgi:hypothetical protein